MIIYCAGIAGAVDIGAARTKFTYAIPFESVFCMRAKPDSSCYGRIEAKMLTSHNIAPVFPPHIALNHVRYEERQFLAACAKRCRKSASVHETDSEKAAVHGMPDKVPMRHTEISCFSWGNPGRRQVRTGVIPITAS
jgi:hypothetical protein